MCVSKRGVRMCVSKCGVRLCVCIVQLLRLSRGITDSLLFEGCFLNCFGQTPGPAKENPQIVKFTAHQYPPQQHRTGEQKDKEAKEKPQTVKTNLHINFLRSSRFGEKRIKRQRRNHSP